MILDVIENEREVVRELHGDRRPQRIGIAFPERLTGQQRQVRSQPLAGSLARLAQAEVACRPGFRSREVAREEAAQERAVMLVEAEREVILTAGAFNTPPLNLKPIT